MKKVYFLMCLFLAPLAFSACSVIDNPTEPYVYNVDDPQEEVTDQPAQSPANPE